MKIACVGVAGTRERIEQVVLWTKDLARIEAGQPVDIVWLELRQTGVLSGIEIVDALALAWLD